MARIDQVKAFLNAAGILRATRAKESCVVIIPTIRLKSGDIIRTLKCNGIPVRSLGHGAGKVRDKFGIERRVSGIVVIAYPSRFDRLLELHTRLCGVQIVRISKTE